MRRPEILAALFFIACAQVRADCSQPAIASDLQAGCNTVVPFCADIVSVSQSGVPTIFTESPSYKTPGYTRTSRFPHRVGTVRVTRTSTISVTRTLVATVGDATTTVQACNSIATCGIYQGPVDGHAGDLREACSCILSSAPNFASTSTIFYSEPYAYTVSFGRTRYSFTRITSQTTLYDTQTTRVPTVTKYDCTTVSPPAQTCGNPGHQYARYTLRSIDQTRDPQDWNVSYYERQTPNSNGTATLLGDISETSYYFDTVKYQNDANFFNCHNDYITDRGYIYAPQTGVYKFDIFAYSNAGFIWVGDPAASGFNTTNAVVAGTTGSLAGPGVSGSKFLKAGNYYPIRTAWGCTESPFDFWVKIIQPDGHIMHGQYFGIGGYAPYKYMEDYNYVDIFSPYIVQYGCGADAAQAPVFPNWGSET